MISKKKRKRNFNFELNSELFQLVNQLKRSFIEVLYNQRKLKNWCGNFDS